MKFRFSIAMTVLVITALSLISTPAILTTKEIFAASINPFDAAPFKSLGLSDLLGGITGKVNTPDTGSSNTPSTDTSNPSNTGSSNTPKSDTSNPTQNNNPSSSSGGAKCGTSGKSTFHWYCAGTHHHCLKGEQNCLLFGGRSS